MDREALRNWLENHPAATHQDPAKLLDRLEEEVRRHAEADAWRAAKAHVENRMHEWEQEWGYHSSEAYAAKEICPELARELRRMEPRFQTSDAPHLVGEELLREVEPEARTPIEEWVRDVANEVEHRIWEEVVRYTEQRGRGLVREGKVSDDSNWDRTTAFRQQAARVARILVDELESHVPSGG